MLYTCTHVFFVCCSALIASLLTEIKTSIDITTKRRIAQQARIAAQQVQTQLLR